MAARVCEEVLDRDCLERAAIGYLPTNPDVADCNILFNKPFMLIIGESQALIRYHTNAMSRELV